MTVITSTISCSDSAAFPSQALAVRAGVDSEDHTYTRLEQYRARKRQLVEELTAALNAGARKGIEPTVVLGWAQNTNRLHAAQRAERFIRTLTLELAGHVHCAAASA
jgi:hypothetical protein